MLKKVNNNNELLRNISPLILIKICGTEETNSPLWDR